MFSDDQNVIDQQNDIIDISLQEPSTGETAIGSLTNTAERIRGLFESIGMIFAKAAEPALTEALRRFGNYLLSIRERIGELLTNLIISDISEDRKKQLQEAHTRWGEYGWSINPVASNETLFDEIPISKKEADRAAIRECSKKQLSSLFQITIESRRCRKADFEEAVSNFQEKRYKSCAHLLVALIESKIIRLQKPSELGNSRRAVGERAVRKAEARVKQSTSEDMLFTLLHIANLLACLSKLFEDGKDFKQQPEVINRNFLDHGMLTRKVTRRDCVQLFLMYYNTLELLDIIYR